jgi:hypothetical protein
MSCRRAISPARKRKATAAPVPAPEAPANPEPPKAAEEALAPVWPTAFVPDVAAGEIAAREYGLLKTRERAVQAATVAGVADPVITQTCRGDWIWRVQALDKVWRENAVADAKKPKAEKAPKVKGAPRKRRGGSKLDIAEALLRRPEGATAEEVASAVEGWDAKSAKIRIGTCLKLTRQLPISSVVEGGRGKVYRIAA